MVLSITEFVGRFHPVLVHLPIGILLLALLFQIISIKTQFQNLQPAVGISLLLGAVSAVCACITGWLLAGSGEYDEATVNQHQWMGIAVAALSLLGFYLHQKKVAVLKWLMPALGILVGLTGHWGGTLTHGDGYLTEALRGNTGPSTTQIKPLANVQQAVVYKDIVQPILAAKCYACHAKAKQKGKLRLDEPSYIDKGGENGKIIVAAQPGESEFIKRILLPLDNDEHMPPRQKPQLSRAEIELLNWWIATGADYHKQTAQLQPAEKVKPYLAALQQGGQPVIEEAAAIPDRPVEPAPAQSIQQLAKLNVAVIPVAKGSHYLSVNFVAADSITDQHIKLLQGMGKQVIWLKLGYTKLSPTASKLIGSLPSLTRLYLNNSNVTDKDFSQWSNLTQLQYVNVTSTAVTANGIAQLKNARLLKQLYVFQSGIKAADIAGLKKLFPATAIDTGGYTLQFLTTDTMLVKAKPKKA